MAREPGQNRLAAGPPAKTRVANEEGRVVSWPGLTGVPFTAEVVSRFAGGSEPVRPAGAAVPELAWRQRARLLG